MGVKDIEQFFLVSSYGDGNEIYHGHDKNEAIRLAKALDNKYTLYTLTREESRIQVGIEKCNADGGIVSFQHMETNVVEMRHLKTLLNFLK